MNHFVMRDTAKALFCDWFFFSTIAKVCSLIPQIKDVSNHTLLHADWNKCAYFWFS